jgi:hypothetical protein
MVAHLFSNVMTATVKPLFSPGDQERYWLIMDAVEFLLALGVLIATRGRLGLKPTNERPVANAEMTYAASLAPRSSLTAATLILARNAVGESGRANDWANVRSARAR